MTLQPIATTLYSLSDTLPGPLERRDDERFLTLFRVGTVIVDDRRELCLIKNISSGGMLIRAYHALAQGTALSVELKRGEIIRGAVSWVRGVDAGVAFDAPIDIIELLSSGRSGPRPRMPRIAVHCAVGVRQGAVTCQLSALDVSQGGIKVETSRPLIVGGDVVVTLPGLPPRMGVVRWHHADCYGISFNGVLPLADLVAWLQGQRQQMRAAG